MTETGRDLTVAEAAAALGISRNHMDQIVYAIGPMADLVSTKDANRRYFSRRDIAVLKIAYAFERFGRPWIFSIADAIELVDAGIEPDEHVILTVARSLPRVRRKVKDRDVSRLQIETACRQDRG